MAHLSEMPSPARDIPADPANPRELAVMSAQDRLRILGSTDRGLSGPDAAARLKRFGPNEPVRESHVHPLRKFALQFTHTLALLLWFAAGLAYAAGIPELGTAILAIILINGVFAFLQEHRAEKVIAGLMRHVAVQARVVRDGTRTIIIAPELVPGDVIHLEAGDIVPADCVLLRSDGMALDLSMLTGETLPVERSSDPVDLSAVSFHIAEVPNMLPSGAGVVTGAGVAAVWATGPASSIGSIASLVEAGGTKASLLESQVAQLSRTTAIVAVTAGAATLCLAAITTETSFTSALTFSTGIIVALVPEGLLPILSVSLAIGATRMATRSIAVRRLSAIEVVGSVTVICTDKTGTLTENAVTVAACVNADGSLTPSQAMLHAAILCNDASQDERGISGDPVDVAFLSWAQAHGVDVAAVRGASPRVETQPFEAARRYMSVSCSIAGKVQRFVTGAPEAVLALTQDGALTPALESAMADATRRGERVILLASGPEAGVLDVIALASFADPLREGVAEAIASCHSAGVRVVMLTGDHRETARSIANLAGLQVGESQILEGRQLDGLSDIAIRNVLIRNTVIARVDPQQKLRVVNLLRAAGEVVVVTGDGINDAPALRSADVGVAMGQRGAEVAKQSADIIIADDHFATIVAAIEEGRSIKTNIRRFISYVFTSNVAEMTPFLVYMFFPVPLPLAVIQALAIDIGTDLLPALALGTERASSREMKVPPEPPGRPLLTRALGVRTFLFFGLIEAALGLAGFFAFYLEAGWRFGSFDPYEALHDEATTITFLAIVGGQVGCLFAQRDGGILQRFDVRTNTWITAGLLFEIFMALILVYTPGLNGVFSMKPVDPAWLLVLAAAALVFTALDQIRRLNQGRTSRSKVPSPGS